MQTRTNGGLMGANFVIFLHLLLNLHRLNGLPAAIGGLLSDDDIPAESMAIQQRTEWSIQVHFRTADDF